MKYISKLIISIKDIFLPLSIMNKKEATSRDFIFMYGTNNLEKLPWRIPPYLRKT
jgi:hypothetical protein